MKSTLLLLLIAWLISKPAFAQAETSLRFQNAAYAGFVAAGLDRHSQWFGAAVLAGYTPAQFTDEAIKSLSLKFYGQIPLVSSTHFGNWHAQLGLATFYNPDSRLFVLLPKQYPSGYYVPTAIRLGISSALHWQNEKGMHLSLEYAVLDSELAFIKDAKRLDRDRLGSFGFGVGWDLGH